jgi:hypothetical protein
VIKGEKQAGFEVQTKRELKEDTEPRRIQEFRTWCDSMIGKDYNEVVKRLGLPGQTADLPNGNKALIFDRGLPGITPPRFETDSNGIVIRWTP